jgi:hypothetical protein
LWFSAVVWLGSVDGVCFLLADRTQFSVILERIFEVSESFDPHRSVSSGGFCASAAFDPSGA